MENRIGIIEVSPELLLDALHIPSGDLDAVQWDFERNVLLLRLHHKDFPETNVYDGSLIPVYKLTIRTHDCGHVCEMGHHITTTREPFQRAER